MSAAIFGRWSDYDDMKSSWFDSYTNYNSDTQKYDPVVFPEDFPAEDQILFASYGGGSYEGDATVIFRRDNKLFEVQGSHCSCRGLENQWKPEETSVAALANKGKKDGDGYGYHFLHDHDRLKEEN